MLKVVSVAYFISHCAVNLNKTLEVMLHAAFRRCWRISGPAAAASCGE